MRKLALSVVVLAACGSASDGVSLESFPQESVQAFCNFAVDCGLMPDKETCLASQDVVDLAQFLSDQEAGLLDPDGALLSRCIQQPGSCDRDFNTDANDVVRLQACLDSVRGNLANGEVCTAASQCAGGVCSRECEEACCEGVCAEGVLPLAGSGESCLGFGCDVGLYCAFEIVDMNFELNCRSVVANGQACEQIDACEDGLFCDFPDQENPGVCGPVAGPGEACAPTSASRTFGCSNITTYCDTGTGTCEPRSEAGEPCDAANVVCMAYASCDGTTCRTRPVENESCDAENGPSCLGNLECVDGSCQFDDAAPGQICTL